MAPGAPARESTFVLDRRDPERILQRLSSLAPLRCAECRDFSDAEALGWRACRIDEVELGEPPELAFFCPYCAALNFDA